MSTIASCFRALARVWRGNREGAAVGKTLAALLIVCVAALGLSLMTVKVWAACSDYYGLEELELPLVCTDADAYVPGATAAIHGFGFGADETVELEVVRADCADVYPPWEAVADPDGNFSTTWAIPATECAAGTLYVTATGLTSGWQAQAVFTDTAPAPAWRAVVDANGVTWARIKIVNNSTEETAWVVSNGRTAIAAAAETAETDAELDWNGVVPAASSAYVWVYGLLSGQINVATAFGTVSGFYEFKEPDPLGDNEWVITVDADGMVTGQMEAAAYGLPLQTGTLPDMTVEEELP